MPEPPSELVGRHLRAKVMAPADCIRAWPLTPQRLTYGDHRELRWNIDPATDKCTRTVMECSQGANQVIFVQGDGALKLSTVSVPASGINSARAPLGALRSVDVRNMSAKVT